MSIDWAHFTPWQSLSGGVLIGAAAAMFVLFNGRILGVSGIVGGLIPLKSGDIQWRIAFLLGLVAAPIVFSALSPVFLMPVARIDATNLRIVIAGLLVGWGTRYGSGCTSGHGVCGLSRMSPRSLLATISFMSAGFLTVFIAGRWL
jgi:uncharacterized membrane protein YedE/YeeE